MSERTSPDRSHLPDPQDPETAPFREGCLAGELRLPRCQTCGRWVWYPRRRCPGCGGRNLSWTRVSGRGRLFTWVTVHRAFLPELAPRVPFVTALVELEEDPALRLAAWLDVPPETRLRVGLSLEAVFEPSDPLLALPRFRPKSD